MPKYIPRRGDFISVTLSAQLGVEQKTRRQALVLSHYLFNKHTNLAIVCPVTSSDQRMPFHLPVTESLRINGFVMVEQVRAIDYRARRARFIHRASPELLNDTLSILDAFVRSDP